MNRENVFDYLLVLEENLNDYNKLAQDYWHSTMEMNSENRHTGRNYCCCIICIGYTREQRKKLSDFTGIPLSRIKGVDEVFDKESDSVNLAKFITADFVRFGNFLGRIKAYASQQDLSLEFLDPSIEVVYAR